MRANPPIPLFLLLACALPAGAAVTGRIISSDGGPVVGTGVAAFALEATLDRAARLAAGRARVPVAKATAAADGSFRLDGTPAVVDIEATVGGWAPAFARLADGEDTTLVLKRAENAKGEVRAAGRPVVGATVVWMTQTEGGETHEVLRQSGADGGYEVPSPASWATGVLVIHPDFAPFSAAPRFPGSDSRLRHELVEGVTIEGRVLDATERGIVGASVAVDGWLLGRSAEGGAFLVRHAPQDWSTLAVRTDALSGAVHARPGRLTVRASPLRRLSGIVREGPSGLPLAGATVTLYGEQQGEALSTTTDTSGRYAVGLPEGRYAALVARPGFESAFDQGEGTEAIDLHRAPPVRRDFALSRLRPLVGRVQDEAGRPIEGAVVRIATSQAPRLYSPAETSSSSMAWTSSGGAFALSLPASEEDDEEWTLTALEPGYAMGVVEHLRAAGAAHPQVVTLAPGVEMAGRVTDPDGTPVPGVAVVLAESSGFVGFLRTAAAESMDTGWTRSGPDGRFSTRVRPTLHELAFLGPGRVPKTVRGHDPSDGVPLEIVLEPSVEIRGRVVGAAVAGLQVLAWGTVLGRPVAATTGGDGSFILAELVPGSYQIQILRDDAPVGAPRSAEAPTAGLQIEMEPEGTIRGRVVDARTRQPLDRFSVVAQRSGEEGPTASMAGQGGAFVLANAPLGDVDLTVRAAGYLTKRVEGLVVTGEPDAPLLELVLESGVTLLGRVTSEDGEPLAEVAVSVAREDADAPSAVSDGRGEYELDGLTPGATTIAFERSGFRTVRRAVEVAEGTRMDVVLPRGISVSGVVLADGKGVPKARVAATSSVAGAGRSDVVTDRAGRFTLSGLSPGRYSVSAAGPKGEEAEAKDVDVEKTGPLQLVLRRSATAVLVGRVVGLADSGDERMVYVEARSEAASESMLVDATGAFRLAKAPVGRVRVFATALSLDGSSRSSRARTVDLVAGSEVETLVEFSDDFVVSGTVTREGATIAGAGVSFGAAGGGARGRTDGSGRYAVAGLEPGSYQVTVFGMDLSFETEYEVTGSAQFDIDATGAALAGTVADDTTGAPVAGAEVSLWPVGSGENRPTSTLHTGATGAFTARNLREGRYRLIASKEGYGQDVRETELRRGSASEVALQITPSDGLGVEVVDGRDGRPLEAVVVVRDAARRIVANRHSGVGEDGALTIPLAAGHYLLSTSADGYGTVTLPVVAPGRGLRVTLTPGGSVVVESAPDFRGRLRLVGADGEEYVRCWCNGIADIDIAGPRTTVSNVTPGAYLATPLDGGGHPISAPRPVLVREGQVSTLTFE